MIRRLIFGTVLVGFSIIGVVGNWRASAATDGFELSVFPSTLHLDSASADNLAISLKGKNGFAGTVTVSASGLPTGIGNGESGGAGFFCSSACAAASNADPPFNLSVRDGEVTAINPTLMDLSDPAEGTYTMTITASASGAETKTKSITVIVDDPVPSRPNVIYSSGNNKPTVTAGQSASITLNYAGDSSLTPYTGTATFVSSFDSASTSGVDSSMSGSFSPGSVTMEAGTTGTTTFTVSTSASTPNGTYAIGLGTRHPSDNSPHTTSSMNVTVTGGTTGTSSTTTTTPSTSSTTTTPSSATTNSTTPSQSTTSSSSESTSSATSSSSTPGATTGTVTSKSTTGRSQTASTTSDFALSSLKVTDVTDHTAIVRWKTTQPATSDARYGLTRRAALYDPALPLAFVTGGTTHEVRLSGLDAGRSYFLRVISRNEAGEQVESELVEFVTTSGPYRLTLEPVEAKPGDQVVARVEGFVPNTDLTLYWRPERSAARSTKSMRVDATGRAVLGEITEPAKLLGQYRLGELTTSGTGTGELTFTVPEAAYRGKHPIGATNGRLGESGQVALAEQTALAELTVPESEDIPTVEQTVSTDLTGRPDPKTARDSFDVWQLVMAAENPEAATTTQPDTRLGDDSESLTTVAELDGDLLAFGDAPPTPIDVIESGLGQQLSDGFAPLYTSALRALQQLLLQPVDTARANAPAAFRQVQQVYRLGDQLHMWRSGRSDLEKLVDAYAAVLTYTGVTPNATRDDAYRAILHAPDGVTLPPLPPTAEPTVGPAEQKVRILLASDATIESLLVGGGGSGARTLASEFGTVVKVTIKKTKPYSDTVVLQRTATQTANTTITFSPQTSFDVIIEVLPRGGKVVQVLRATLQLGDSLPASDGEFFQRVFEEAARTGPVSVDDYQQERTLALRAIGRTTLSGFYDLRYQEEFRLALNIPAGQPYDDFIAERLETLRREQQYGSCQTVYYEDGRRLPQPKYYCQVLRRGSETGGPYAETLPVPPEPPSTTLARQLNEAAATARERMLASIDPTGGLAALTTPTGQVIGLDPSQAPLAATGDAATVQSMLPFNAVTAPTVMASSGIERAYAEEGEQALATNYVGVEVSGVPVQLALIDPLGRSFGVNPVDGGGLSQIPGAFYLRDGTADQAIVLPNVHHGQYRLSLRALEAGTLIGTVTVAIADRAYEVAINETLDAGQVFSKPLAVNLDETPFADAFGSRRNVQLALGLGLSLVLALGGFGLWRRFRMVREQRRYSGQTA